MSDQRDVALYPAAELTIRHIYPAKAADAIGVAVFARNERKLFDLVAVKLPALILGHLEGDHKVGLPLLAYLVVDHRGSAAVGAKAHGVVGVCGFKLRAAGRTDVGVAVEGLFGLGFVGFKLVKRLGLKLPLTVLAEHLLRLNIEPQSRSAGRTMYHMITPFEMLSDL